jgi:hypothetical protein
MQISRQEILEILAKNAINKEFAEQIAMAFGKGLGNSLIDIVGLIVQKTPNALDDMGFAAIEPKLRKYVNDLDITL